MSACETETITEQSAYSKPVIQSFYNPEGDSLIVGISRMIPYLSEDDTLAQPITGLDVWAGAGEDSLLLQETDDQSGMYSTTKIHPVAGDSLHLYVEIDEQIFSASTVVPEKPGSVSISSSSLYVSTDTPMGMMNAEEIIVSWDNEEEGFYYLSITNLEEDPVPVNEMVEDLPTRKEAPPSQADQFRIRFMNLMFFGTYEIVLYRVNQEYVNLFDNPTMSSISLTEPPGNIENGLGVFTAFTTDTVYLEVISN